MNPSKDNSSLMADAFSRALTPAPETVAFYETLRTALAEIKAEEEARPMTLREVWIENRRRAKVGLPSIDRFGREIVRTARTARKPLSDQELAEMAERTRQSYDPSSPNYRQYQGD